MRPTEITRLASCALAVAALAAAGSASGQGAAFNPGFGAHDAQGNVLPGANAVYPQAGEMASSTTGLYDNALFPQGRSNKVGCGGGRGGVAGQPHVVNVFPAKGAVVRPGIVVVRVTYDRPMSCDASFGGRSDLPNPCPGQWREVTMSQDGRSFRTVCEVAPNSRYRLVLRSFKSEGNVLAKPYDVSFSTSGATLIGSIREALAEDVGGPTTAGG
jgi:hypothetical protein